ncbi:MAG TPA: methyltransferase domain-containing protein [Longimicrobium sp.]|nr:methyltransferase domain-containing protein [Longimicrobium sp.]
MAQAAREAVERETGRLFSDLWHRYDDAQYKHSVELFRQRWLANGEPEDFFGGKRCLDVGCGGGRYTIAMARMGASEAVGVDLGEAGLEDARARARALGIENVRFQGASALELPFPDASFDFVCCSGVLHHTVGVERGLREIRRVLRPGGGLYILLYGAGGLYWPLNLVMRPFAAALGKDEVERCLAAAGLPAAKQRTVLDDLFVPVLETYTRERVDHLLREAGFADARWWGGGQLDHESDPATLIEELRQREALWRAGAASAPSPELARQVARLADLCGATVAAAEELAAEHAAGRLAAAGLREAVVGHGHHRVVARAA